MVGIDNILLGLETALSLDNLLFCMLGVSLGMFIGVIPGLGAITAISLLLPVTYHMELTPALIMLAGIWYGASYGGSTSAILLNIPGTPSSVVACFDGYPMSRQGRAGVALLITAVASFVGGSIGILLMMFFGPLIASYARTFGSVEYFSLIVLGLVAASTASQGSTAKSLAAVTLGLVFGTVGLDMYTGAERLTLGIVSLSDGIGLVALAMGLFGVAEIISSVGRVKRGSIDHTSVGFRSMMPTREDVSRSIRPILRGAASGSFFGTLPGTGPAIAAYMAYAIEKRISREPERFGKGAVEGISAPESANNAADQTSFIPTLTLGIPGSPTMALILGALIIHGVTPGPQLITNEASLFWGLVMSFWIGNLLLLVLNIPLIGLWVRLLLLPYNIVFPAVLTFIAVGVYSVSNNVFDVQLALFFGVLGYSLRLLDFPAAPVLLGFVLGPLLEEHFRRAMLLSRGDPMVFLQAPLSATVLTLTAAILLFGIWSATRQFMKKETPPATKEG